MLYEVITQQGRTEEAISMLRTAQEADPENNRVQFSLIGLYLDAGRLGEAESLLDALPWAVQEEANARKLRALLDVITSYSIHYTKLYDQSFMSSTARNSTLG